MNLIWIIIGCVVWTSAAFSIGCYLGLIIGAVRERGRHKPDLDQLALYRTTYIRSDWVPVPAPGSQLRISVDGGKSFYLAEKKPDGRIEIKAYLAMLPYLGETPIEVPIPH